MTTSLANRTGCGYSCSIAATSGLHGDLDSGHEDGCSGSLASPGMFDRSAKGHTITVMHPEGMTDSERSHRQALHWPMQLSDQIQPCQTPLQPTPRHWPEHPTPGPQTLTTCPTGFVSQVKGKACWKMPLPVRSPATRTQGRSKPCASDDGPEVDGFGVRVPGGALSFRPLRWALSW
jgi:hypothetical protein